MYYSAERDSMQQGGSINLPKEHLGTFVHHLHESGLTNVVVEDEAGRIVYQDSFENRVKAILSTLERR